MSNEMSEVEVGKPTKIMPLKEFYEKTDNAKNLMGRVWYLIASSKPDVAEQKIFWEHWYWKEGQSSKNLSSATKRSPKVGCNHTYTVTHDGKKEIDWPIWPIKFTPEEFLMSVVVRLCCFTFSPLTLTVQPIAFPTDDSPKQFRVDYFEVMGKPEYFIFVLDPRISEEDMAIEFDKLKNENGIKREWFHFVQWDKNYQIGSGGEPDINPYRSLRSQASVAFVDAER